MTVIGGDLDGGVARASFLPGDMIVGMHTFGLVGHLTCDRLPVCLLAAWKFLKPGLARTPRAETTCVQKRKIVPWMGRLPAELR